MTGIDTCFLIDLYWEDSPRHAAAVALFKQLADSSSEELAIYYNCFNEFVHVITDARRFENPLSMSEALSVVDEWCELERVHILYPDDDSFTRAVTSLTMYKLGRNRINDTQMASCYIRNAVFSLVTANPKDFAMFGMFALIDYRSYSV